MRGRNIRAIGTAFPQGPAIFSAVLLASSAAPVGAAIGPVGWIYYGAKWSSEADKVGSNTDGGKLRPATRTRQMPRWNSIKPGDRFILVQQANLRSGPTQNALAVLDRPLDRDDCVQILELADQPYTDLDLESGGWVKVRQVSCRGGATTTSNPNTSPFPAQQDAGRNAQMNEGGKAAEAWTFLRENNELLLLVGGALAGTLGGAWAVFVFFVDRRDKRDAALRDERRRHAADDQPVDR